MYIPAKTVWECTCTPDVSQASVIQLWVHLRHKWDSQQSSPDTYSTDLIFHCSLILLLKEVLFICCSSEVYTVKLHNRNKKQTNCLWIHDMASWTVNVQKCRGFCVIRPKEICVIILCCYVCGDFVRDASQHSCPSCRHSMFVQAVSNVIE